MRCPYFYDFRLLRLSLENNSEMVDRPANDSPSCRFWRCKTSQRHTRIMSKTAASATMIKAVIKAFNFKTAQAEPQNLCNQILQDNGGKMI
jgi:hypothetical protein